MKEIETIHGQTLGDIAAQHYGSSDGVAQLVLDNPTKLNYDDDIPAGTVLMIDEEKVIDKKVVEEFAKPGALPPATRFVNTNNWCLATGYWDDGGIWIDTEYWHDN